MANTAHTPFVPTEEHTTLMGKLFVAD